MDAVERWLADLSNPPPDAVTLAAYVCRQAGTGEWNREGRDAVLRLARMALALDSKMREQHENGLALALRLDQTRAALRDSAHTCVVALTRLEEQGQVLEAAVTWERAGRAGPSRDFLEAAGNLRAAVQAHNQRVEARS